MEEKTEEKVLDRNEILANEDMSAIQAELEAELVKQQEEIAGLTIEELKAAEEALMEEFKANDEHLKEVTYELADSVEYDGIKLKSSDVAKRIIGFLNRLEVDFRATLGIHQAIRFWKAFNNTPIPYGAFDSTLRLLGTMKFKGETDCFDILAINNWFTSGHEAYSRDNIWTQFLSAKHQAIMTAMEQLEKSGTEPTSEPQEA